MRNKKVFLEIIMMSFLCLWGYAAFSKIFEFQIFKYQLSESPLLSDISGIVSILVPAVEIFIVVLLIIDRTKRLGLYLSLSLLTVFTIYLIGILNFSKNIPCSCGGVLQNITWTQHIIMNSGFIVLAIIGLILQRKTNFKIENSNGIVKIA